MRTFFFLCGFFTFISVRLNAQTDSLKSENSLQPIKTDSLTTTLFPISDSLLFNPIIHVSTLGPWYCDPEINLSHILVSTIALESPYTPKGARNDIKTGKPVILFAGGFGGMPDFSSKEDREFQKKYGIKFYAQGCVRMPNDDQEGYNKVIFDYLDKKYGKDWRYEISDGAIAFEAPEKPLVSKTESTAEFKSPLAMQFGNPGKTGSESLNPETETSVWWYILPTSGFALLLSLYFIKKKKK